MLFAVLLTVILAAEQTAQHIQFSALVPLVNTIIVALGAVATAAVPVLVTYAVLWLRGRNLIMSAQLQTELVKQADNVIQKGVAYSTTVVDDKLNHLIIEVKDPNVAAAVNFAIVQAPDLLKRLGFDTTTKEGQEAIVRMVLARQSPLAPPPTSDANVTLEVAKPSAGV